MGMVIQMRDLHGLNEQLRDIRVKRMMSVPGATCLVRIWIESGDYVISD